ncbi:MAG: TonB-dependent receptor [Pseudomonadota bacterium]
MKKSNPAFVKGLTVVVSMLLLGSVEMVQAQTDEDIDDDLVGEDIIVEGEKFSRSYVDTFSSVGILTDDTIEELKIEDIKEGFKYLGNVRFFEGNRGNNGFVIRGLNSEGVTQPENNAPLTSVIIDGATQSVESTRRGARGIWDVRQVEVFRGPQSTLQGRGALAGAVIVKTNDPTFEWEFGARGRLGNDDQEEGAFFVSGPIIEDQLAMRISGEARSRDFDIEFDPPENENIGEDRFLNLRGKLLLEPEAIPDLSVLLTASTTYDKPGVNAVNGDNFFDRVFMAAPTAVEIREATNNNYILDATWSFSEDLELQSISSYIDSELTISTPNGSNVQREESRAGKDFTQDLRLKFGDVDDSLNGVVGFFFGNFTLPRDSLVTAGNGAFIVQELTSNDRTRNFSVYGDVRWEFIEDFSFIGGLRYTYESVTNEREGTSFGAPIDVDQTADFNVLLPKVGLAYEISENQTIAVTAQRGYRSGFAQVSGQDITVVDPEFLWNHEIAYRAQGEDGDWNFGATGFYYRYTNQQIPINVFINNIPQPVTVNAGRSRAFGLELDGRYNFDFGLSVFGSLGYLNTTFTALNTADSDFTGNEYPEAPRLTAAAGGTYSHPSGAFLSADVVYTSGYFSGGSISNDPALRVDGFFEVGLRAGYETEYFKMQVFADNLLDQDIITSLNNNGNFGATPLEATVADGLRVGLEASVNF